MTHRFIALIFIICSFLSVNAKTQYYAYFNQFGEFLVDNNAQSVIDGTLFESNQSTLPSLRTVAAPAGTYRFLVRFSHRNNSPDKGYTIFDNTGHKRKIKHTECGIVFDYTDAHNYLFATIAYNNFISHDDINPRCSFTLTVSRCQNNNVTQLYATQIEQTTDDYKSVQSLCVTTTSDGTFIIAHGTTHLTTVCTLPRPELTATPRVGYYLGAGAKIGVERLVTSASQSLNIPDIKWTKEQLDNHFLSSRDPYEGYWTYLDRETDDNTMRLGGRYTIAIVARDSGYDIFFVDGAKVNADKWACGMTKGRLTPTIFTDNYTATWTDATFNNITSDVYATFESGAILSVKFPTHRSQIRFSKVLQP